MKKIRILLIGYSSFARRRIIPSFLRNNRVVFCISSKSNKINFSKKILFNNYQEAIKEFRPNLVYISTVNSLHFNYAKKILNLGINLIVDKPVAPTLKKTQELLKIAKKKKLFFAEATLFNYHRVFNVIKKIYGKKEELQHIQSNLNHPIVRKIKEIKEIQGDCESDMANYAAAILRLFSNTNFKKLSVNKHYFKNTKVVKSFYVTSSFGNCTLFGNFSFQREYTQQIIFYTNDKIIFSPQRIFALPPNKDLEIIVKRKNKFEKIKVKKDDCIKNFINYCIHSIKEKKFNFFYETMLKDAKVRDFIKKKR